MDKNWLIVFSSLKIPNFLRPLAPSYSQRPGLPMPWLFIHHATDAGDLTKADADALSSRAVQMLRIPKTARLARQPLMPKICRSSTRYRSGSMSKLRGAEVGVTSRHART